MSDMSAIFLGFVAILLTLFFVNLDRARRIKAEYLAARNMGFVLRNMALLLDEIKEKMDKIEEKHDKITKTNNTLEKLFHYTSYLHQNDQLIYNIGILGIYNETIELDINNLDFACDQYYKGNSPSNVMSAVYRASQGIRRILRLDWHTRYGGRGFGNIADLIIRRDVYDGKSYNELMSSLKQSRYENDPNRATPI